MQIFWAQTWNPLTYKKVVAKLCRNELIKRREQRGDSWVKVKANWNEVSWDEREFVVKPVISSKYIIEEESW